MKQKLLLTLILWLALLGSAWAQSNNALHFSYATQNRVDIGAFAAGSPNFSQGFTFAGWVKFDQFKDLARVFTFAPSQADGSNNLMLSASGTTGLIMAEVNVQKVTTTTPLQTNKWYFLTLTVTSGGVTTIYVDGVSAASKTLTAPANIARNTCYLGNSSYDEARGLNGSLDEVSIWSRALSATEITGIMNGISSPTTQTGLLAYYTFNQGTAGGINTSVTTLTDATTNAKNGTLKDFTLSGATSNWVAGYTPPTPPAANNALHFNGNTDYVQCPAVNPANFTMEAWVYPTQLGRDQAVISTLSVNNTTGMELHVATENKPLVTIRNDDGWLDVKATSTIALNTWAHLAATYDGSAVKLYINGVEAVTAAAASYASGASNLFIGRRPDNEEKRFAGRIDEVRIWGVARTQSEIENAKNNPLAGNEANLLAYYNFNHGTAGGSNITITTLTDATTNSNNGTLNGFALSGTTSNFVEGFVPPAASGKYLTVSPTSLILGSANGSSATITVTSNTDWEISPIFTEEPWAVVNPTSGSGNGSFTVTTTSENTGATGRGAVLNISGEEVESIYMNIGQSAPLLTSLTYTTTDGASNAKTGASLAAIFMSTPLGQIKTIEITGGDFTTADWEWLKANKNNFASLASFTIAPTVNSVADVPSCTNSDAVFANGNIQEIILHKVSKVNSYAFSNLTSLVTVNLPNATIINEGVFIGCYNLTSASLPNVTSLGVIAFMACNKLNNLMIGTTPPSVIHPNVFESCPSPRYLSYADANGNLIAKGAAWEAAKEAYRAANDGNTTDNLWYGWIIDRNLYNVGVATPNNGTLTAENPSDMVFGGYPAGANINVTATPSYGYKLANGSPRAYKTDDQSVEVTITNGTFTMPDYGVTVTATFLPKLSASANTVTLGKEAEQSQSVTITCDGNYEITNIEESPDWLQVGFLTMGETRELIFTTKKANPWAFEREVVFTLTAAEANDITITVKQMAADPQTTFSTGFVELEWQQGSTATIEMQSNEKWTVTENVPAGLWQVEPQSGEGNATFTITALTDNGSKSNLSGRIKVNNHVIYLSQKFDAKPLEVSDTLIRLSAQKGSSMQVQVTTETSWKLVAAMATELPDWLSVSHTSGKGNTTITFTTKYDLTRMVNNTAIIVLDGDGAYPEYITVEQAADNMPQGKGTKEEPYLISTFDHLMWMSLNTREELYNAPHIHYQLAGDIDASASHAIEGGFPGIPYYNSRVPFYGSFNGKGYAIKNFLSTTGLFTKTEEKARIDSLALVNVMVQGSEIGGLVGISNEGTVNACYATGMVIGLGSSLITKTNEGTISDCYAVANIVGPSSAIMHSGENVERCYVVAKTLPGFQWVFNEGGNQNVNGYYNSDIFQQTASPSPEVKGLTTVQMTQQANYTDWDFEKMWSITEDVSFPRIKGVYNYPLLMPTYATTAEIGELYETILTPISMDALFTTIQLTKAPAGMTLDGNTISWTPTSGGWYNITVTITDANDRTVDYTIPISIMPKGEGTEDEPYQITTIAELNLMRYMDANAHYRLMNDLDFTGTEFSKENSEQGWLPITFGGALHGLPEMAFQGYFHGGGHVIRNLYINRPYTANPVGLFEQISSTIDSLGLENVYVEGNERVGALAGYMTTAKITACYVTGTVRGFEKTGGLMGEAVQNTNLIRSYANVTVQGTSRIHNENVVARYHFGALAGCFDNGSIENCYAAGSVTGATQVGGICGSLTQTNITHCYSTAVGRTTDGNYHGLTHEEDYNTVDKVYCYKPLFIPDAHFYTGDDTKYSILNHSQLTAQASYEGWDFTNTWEITENQSLPRLRGMKNFPVLLPVMDVAQMNVEYLSNLYIVQMGSPINSFATSGVEGITIDENSTTIKWTPTTGEQQTLTVSIKAENGDSIAIATSIEVIPFAGEGTLDNPYQITTIAQLNAVRSYSDKVFVLMNDLNFDGSPYSKENSRFGWEPIAEFSGTFNGNGHLIKNLYINTHENGVVGGGVGLFATITKDKEIPMVYNLGLVNVDIRTNSEYDNTGALCGTLADELTKIHHCYVTGTIYGNDQRTGGIVGSIEDKASVTDSYSHASVTTPGNRAGGALGGIAGYNSNSYIERCYATGMVKLENMATPANAGSICGMNYGPFAVISNCFTTQGHGAVVGRSLEGAQDNSAYLDETQAKQEASYVNWDFNNNGWAIAEGEGMPALTALSNNAPAAFDADEIVVGSRIGMDKLLPFGYDHETAREKMVVKPIQWDDENLYSDGSTYVGIKPGSGQVSNAPVIFQIGEVVAPADTIWGGRAITLIQRPGGTNNKPGGGYSDVTIDEDNVLENYDALALANDADGDYLTIVRMVEGYPLRGTATIVNNRINYQPNANYFGPDELRYIITDGDYEVECQIFVTVTSVNDAPVLTAVLNKDTYEDEPLTLTFNDVTATDVDNFLYNLQLVIAPGDNYTVNGTTITPAENYHGTLSVGISVSDGELTSAQMTMTVTVLPVNDVPVLTAVKDKTINEDESITITMADVTAYDVDSDELQIVIDPETSGGEKSNAATKGTNYTVSGTTITPAKDFHGTLKVNISVRDMEIETNPKVMTITVLPVNDAPVLTAVSTHVLPEDESITLTMYDVVATDVDNAQDELQLIVYEGENYTVNGTAVTPAPNFHGTINVPVAVTDGELTSSQMAIEITVNPVNDAPVLTAVSSLAIDEDGSVTLTLDDVTAIDVDNAEHELQLIVYEGENYTVNGTSIIAVANFYGTLNVPVAVSDGELTSNQMVMEITVNSVNDAPVLTAVTIKSIKEGETLTLTMADVTATDADGDALTLVIANGNNYTVSGTTITPASGFTGTLSVGISVTDGELTSNQMVMTVTVTALDVNSAPILTAVANKSIKEGETLTLSMADVTATDAEGDALSLVIANGNNYTVSGNTITPASGFTGTLSVGISVTDGELTSNQMVMTVTVTAVDVNSAPVLTAVANKSIKEGETLTLTMADVTATDAEGDALSLVIANGNNYTVSGNTITPASGFTGTLSVGISVTDGELTSNQMVMTVTVTPATGMDDNTAATVSAYPNPFTDYVVIESEEPIRSVSFINLLGKTVQHTSMPETRISTQNLLPGIYLIKVDFAKGKPVVTRMVKQ